MLLLRIGLKDAPTPVGGVRNLVLWCALRASCGFLGRPDAGSVRPFVVAQRPAIVRPVSCFVKRQTTTYCAYVLGHAQYVDFIVHSSIAPARACWGL